MRDIIFSAFELVFFVLFFVNGFSAKKFRKDANRYEIGSVMRNEILMEAQGRESSAILALVGIILIMLGRL